MTGSGFKLQHRFRLDIEGNSLMRMVKYWNMLPSDVAESMSFKTFSARLDVALGSQI